MQMLSLNALDDSKASGCLPYEKVDFVPEKPAFLAILGAERITPVGFQDLVQVAKITVDNPDPWSTERCVPVITESSKLVIWTYSCHTNRQEWIEHKGLQTLPKLDTLFKSYFLQDGNMFVKCNDTFNKPLQVDEEHHDEFMNFILDSIFH